MKYKTILLIIISGLITACANKTNTAVTFPEEIELSETPLTISKDSLARIEGIQCNDSLLIVWDFNSGKSFTLFNTHTEHCYGRFGDIGQGPTDIPLGCGGSINQGKYKITNCVTGYIAQYDVDSLCANINQAPQVLCRKTFNDDFFLSWAMPVNDSLFFGAGVFNSKNQYALFNNKEKIIDSNVMIFNAFNDLFNISSKMLSNQGRLTKAPNSDKFAFFLNNSSNIDFIEVANNKINVLKLQRERDPMYTPVQEGTSSMVVPDRNSPTGYIDVTSDENFVYALHSDKAISQKRSSDLVYVFDWKGNPSKTYKLTQEAYYITVNESGNRLYAAVKEEDGGWGIISYSIK